jgi:hypothetical protein
MIVSLCEGRHKGWRSIVCQICICQVCVSCRKPDIEQRDGGGGASEEWEKLVLGGKLVPVSRADVPQLTLQLSVALRVRYVCSIETYAQGSRRAAEASSMDGGDALLLCIVLAWLCAARFVAAEWVGWSNVRRVQMQGSASRWGRPCASSTIITTHRTPASLHRRPHRDPQASSCLASLTCFCSCQVD